MADPSASDRLPSPPPDTEPAPKTKPKRSPITSPVAPPRAGELSLRWRLATVGVWALVAAAQGTVWKVSDQLGLSTWWLGPRGDPQPTLVRLLPFLPALAMAVAAINNVRRIPWWGVLAAAVTVAIGVADLGYVSDLGLLEIGIGAAAALMSMASASGMYRAAR